MLGKIYFYQGEFQKSAIAFEKVLSSAKETFLDNYLDASLAWYSLNTLKGTERAKALLDVGIDKLGENMVLFQSLISVAFEQKIMFLPLNIKKES